MDLSVATSLAEQLGNERQQLCSPVAARMLRAFPELNRSLRLEESYSPTNRLSEMAVERLNELVRSVLLFEAPSLAEHELRWAYGVLPPHGVTFEHQSTMVRWYFEEVRKLQLSSEEHTLTYELERFLLSCVRQVYRRN
ncbi:MAG: hypothetical protein HC822_24955 [Oscillochloris sp.]|nr:hypothetical protein [Oscillochloris sp.]